jgi:spermidine/putrescine-binding protein
MGKKTKIIRYIILCSMIIIGIVGFILFSNVFSKKKNIYIMTWTGALDSILIEKFEKKYNAKVHVKFYSSNEELISKLSIYNKNIDIIFPSDYIVNDLFKKKLIKPIQIKKIVHFDKLLPDLLNKVVYNKKHYGVPAGWGAFGIALNESLYKKMEPNSDILKIFFTGKNKRELCKIAVINDMATMTNNAYQYYKYNFKKNKIYNKKNLFTILHEILEEQKKNVILYTYDDYLGPIFEHNIVDMALIESGRYLKIIENLPNINLKFIFSSYYILKVCEYMALAANAQNEDLCYQFINFMLEEEQILYSSKNDFSFSPRKDLLYKTIPQAQEIIKNIQNNKHIALFTDDILNKRELIALWMKLKS